MIAEYIVPNEETISKIRAGNIEVRNRYFMENYAFLRVPVAIVSCASKANLRKAT